MTAHKKHSLTAVEDTAEYACRMVSHIAVAAVVGRNALNDLRIG